MKGAEAALFAAASARSLAAPIPTWLGAQQNEMDCQTSSKIESRAKISCIREVLGKTSSAKTQLRQSVNDMFVHDTYLIKVKLLK